MAAITARSGGAGLGFTLFTPPSLPERDRWDGARMRPEAAAEVFGADEAYPSTEVPGRRKCGCGLCLESITGDSQRQNVSSSAQCAMLLSPCALGCI